MGRLGVRAAEVGATEKVVGAGAVIIRQADENVGRDVALAHFVVRIADLRAAQILGKVLLPQVAVLPQVADALIHSLCSFVESVTESINKTFCYIAL